jgi:hypothetical protein
MQATVASKFAVRLETRQGIKPALPSPDDRARHARLFGLLRINRYAAQKPCNPF